MAHTTYMEIHTVNKSKLSLAILAALITTQANASSSAELDTVSVTATRSAEEILKQPLSVVKKGAEEKQLDQAIFQKDVLNSVAGVSIKQTGSVIGHTAAIRTPNTTLPYFLYLQDNVPVQSSGFFNHNAMAYTNFQTAQTAEVIKGAGTALYGSDSVAATVNIQSAVPSKTLERKVNLYGGSDGFKQGGFSVSNTLKDDSSYRFDASMTDSDGWREHTNMKRHEINGQYNFSTEDNDFKVAVVSNHSRAQQAGSLIGLSELETNRTSIGDLASSLSKVDAMRQFDHNRLSLEWDSYQLKDVDLNTIAYVRNTRNQYTATWEKSLPHNDSQQNTLGIMHKGTLNPSWGRFIYGLDSEMTQGKTLYTQQFEDVANSVAKGTIYDYKIDYLAISPYIHSDWNLTDKTTLSAGLRYDSNQYQYKNNTADGQYASSKFLRVGDRNDSYTHLSPKVALNYTISPQAIVYGRYANSFRVPSASRLYSLKTNNASFTLNPETSDTFEVGYKLDGKSTDIEVAFYYMNISDTITRYEDGSGDRYYDNGGTTINKGLEISLSQTFSSEWSSKVAFSRSEHRFENDTTYGNNEMASAPNNKVNVRFFYSPNQIQGLKLMAEADYNSDYYMDHSHTKSYAGYKVFNLKADYDVNKTWRVFAKVDNVTDEVYAESASYGYGKEKYTPAAPRQVFLGVNATW